ncbi:MAG TPA: sodium:proton antiporter [Gemmatimonadales bacterium]|nr:sodium:proton antiporter [Gemmatimonadales bacterium]
MTALAAELPLAAVVPFFLLLAAIAVSPLAFPHWWESNRNKAIVVAIISLPVALYLATAWGPEGRTVLAERALEYVSFIVLLAALFVISGGVYIQGTWAGTPLVNTAMLGVGALLANLTGTTGASVLLIRPLLRANRSRQRKAHIVVFFIFVVSNCAGLLTPLGDPPLFLGFLKGVPFEWTLRLWPQWLVVNLALLAIFNVWDQVVFDREEKERPGSQLEQVMQHEPLRVRGVANLLFLVAVAATIIAAGRGWRTDGRPWGFGSQEAMLAVLALAAYALTPKEYREKNEFRFGPIVEVAVLFAGIFITMAPALEILNAWGRGQREVLGMAFAVTQPWQFFWATGVLSSVLDNAPTYLSFSATAAGLYGVPAHGPFVGGLLGTGPEAARVLAAISTGAVFMGANTYIGNGPNFMVKAIAEAGGVRMPSFFGYLGYSLGVLIPVFVAVTWLFFR